MHVIFVTQRHGFGAGGGADSHSFPLLLLRVWPLCSASWDVLSRTCARCVSAATPRRSAVVKNGNQGRKQQIIGRTDRLHARLIPTQSWGRGSGGRFPSRLLKSIGSSFQRPPVAEPLVLTLWKLPGGDGEIGLEKKHLFIWLRITNKQKREEKKGERD